MVKVLVVDDEVLRRELLKQIVETTSGPNENHENDCEIEFASTYAQGLYQIQNKKFDYILLDHDLGERDDIQFDLTGYGLARVIKDSVNKDSIVVVISLNPAGVANILSVLPNAVQCPVYLVAKQWGKIRRMYAK